MKFKMHFLESPLIKDNLDTIYSTLEKIYKLREKKFKKTTITSKFSHELLTDKGRYEASKLDILEFKNHLKTIQFLHHIPKRKKITKSLLLEIHEILLNEIEEYKKIKRKFRSVQNYIIDQKTNKILYKPPTAKKAQKLLQEFLFWLNSQKALDPILKAAIAEFQMMQIHPFFDGNGRVARALSTLCLIQNNIDFKNYCNEQQYYKILTHFFFEHYYKTNRKSYYKALGCRNKKNDLKKWLEYFSLQLNKEMKFVLNFISKF
jgi:Fic family protein